MKRTLLALATLMVVTLLSCSSPDNSSSPTGDMNFPEAPTLKRISPSDEEQDQALKKASPPVDEVQGVYSSLCRLPTGPSPYTQAMSVTNVPVGSYAWSNKLCFDFSSIVPPYSTNLNYRLTCHDVGGNGSFNVIGHRIECGQYYLDLPYTPTPGGATFASTSTTTAFEGLPATVDCCVSFYGQCTGGYTLPNGTWSNNCNYHWGDACNFCQTWYTP